MEALTPSSPNLDASSTQTCMSRPHAVTCDITFVGRRLNLAEQRIINKLSVGHEQ
jgi:hypothetical protein